MSEPSCCLSLKVVPGASDDASAALRAFLAHRLGLQTSALHLIIGEISRLKFTADDAPRRLLAASCAPS